MKFKTKGKSVSFKNNNKIVKPDNVVKSNRLAANIPKHLTYETTGIKIGQDRTIEMNVGDDLGLIVHLLPHHYSRPNLYKVTTSNKEIVDVNDMVLTAKKVGTCDIIASTLDNRFSDIMTVNVVEKEVFKPINIYVLDTSDFDFIEDDYSYLASVKNVQIFESLIEYCKKQNIEKVVFPENKKYYLDPAEIVYLKNNLVIDLNGSKLITAPNPYKTYTLFTVQESNKAYNILEDSIWIKQDETELECLPNNQFKESDWVDENGANRTTYKLYDRWTYHLDYAGDEDGTLYLKDSIEVKNETAILEQYIVPNTNYNVSLTFSKYGDPNNSSLVYTDNTVSLVFELYKNGVLQSEKTIASLTWNRWSRYRQNKLSANFVITEDIDTIKVKLTGLSDPLPVGIIVSKLQIRKLTTSDDKVQNVYFKNGSLLGERYIYEADGTTEIKNTLLQKYYSKTYQSMPELEGSLVIAVHKGKNIEFENMEIGNSIGFNMGIDTTGNNSYYSVKYPNAKNIEYGKFDINGEPIDSDTYARFTEFVEIDLSKSQYFVITDPTFTNIYYYGYRSRLVDIYCYDENKQCLIALEGKLRHGIIKAPEGTKYIKIAVPLISDEGLIITGNSDFGNCIFAIKSIYETKNVVIKNCHIANNYSCGIAMSGAYILVEDCIFENNIGRIACAGINFVFKQNTFKSVTVYDQCMHFKFVQNNFITGGYTRSFNGNQDNFIINNCFVTNSTDTPVTLNVANFDRDYNYYVERNIFTDQTSVRIVGNAECANNYYVAPAIEVKGENSIFVDGFNSEHMNEYCSNVKKIIFTSEVNPSNCNYTGMEVTCGANQTFTNCIFDPLPTYTYNSKSYKLTFDNCTIYNAVISSNLIFNDNCTIINGVQKSLLVDGVVENGLILTLAKTGGKYKIFNDQVANFDKDFTIQLLMHRMNMSANKAVGFITDNRTDGNTVTINVNYINEGMQYNGWVFDVDGNKERVYSYGNDKKLGDPSIYTLELTYKADTRTLTSIVNGNILDFTKTPSAGFNFNLEDPTLSFAGNSTINKMYLYDRVLSEDELVQNSKILIEDLTNKN